MNYHEIITRMILTQRTWRFNMIMSRIHATWLTLLSVYLQEVNKSTWALITAALALFWGVTAVISTKRFKICKKNTDTYIRESAKFGKNGG